MGNTPINIQNLQPSSVVRIQLAPKYIIQPVSKTTAEIQRNQVMRPSRRTSFVGRVLSNNFHARSIVVDFQDLTLADQHLTATVLYKQIRTIELQLQSVGDNVHRLRIPAYVPVLGVF